MHTILYDVLQKYLVRAVNNENITVELYPNYLGPLNIFSNFATVKILIVKTVIDQSFSKYLSAPLIILMTSDKIRHLYNVFYIADICVFGKQLCFTIL